MASSSGLAPPGRASTRSAFLLALALALAACGDARRVTERPSRPTTNPSPSPTASDLGYYDGEIHGWDIGPDADDQGRNLNLDCKPRDVGAGTSTELDFRITYMPKNIGRPSHEPQISKVVCGTRGLSVTYNFDWDDNPYEGIATLRIERSVTGVRARSLYARKDLVKECTVRGSPAVCVHYEDDSLGRGPAASIFIVEDDTLDPYATTLLITDATGIPFAELMKIAEGVR